mmetsp:Transcript_50920/g.131288  ORF Transcript_50920/g.131288 Transcript_50920/m.131288 type:complete len:343 (+) Transcript_50920:110-1138(+)
MAETEQRCQGGGVPDDGAFPEIHEIHSMGLERAVSAPDCEDLARAHGEPPVREPRPRRHRLSLAPVDGDLEDPRRAVVAPVVQLKLEPLTDRLTAPPHRLTVPVAAGRGPAGAQSWAGPAVHNRLAPSPTSPSTASQPSGPTPLSELIAGYASRVCQPCVALLTPFWQKAVASSAPSVPSKSASSHPPHRWFRIHPMGDGRYFVRPDAGWRGRVPGSHREVDKEGEEDDEVRVRRKSKGDKLRKTKSTPAICERRIGLVDPPGFEIDAFRNCCCVCYERPVQVITLPCRHGCLCEECLRRTLFSRPAHRGGRMCPVCRRNVTEVVWIYGDAAIPQYGFTIKS